MNTESESPRDILKEKLRRLFDGSIVRKDLTKRLKEGANVPVYVLEYLLGSYCNSDDEAVIAEGVERVKQIISRNFVRPDESQKVLSMLRQKGTMTIIDRVSVTLSLKDNCYLASFSNLGITGVEVPDEYACRYERLLCGGIWCKVTLEYTQEDEEGATLPLSVERNDAPARNKRKKQQCPLNIMRLSPIQLPTVDMDILRAARKEFTKDEWMTVLLRSMGMEPEELTERQRWLLLLRMVPLVEKNFNLCELGPRSTGKSHLYKEISPNSILISGGQTTVANLFYNMSSRAMGLVGLWDCVAFDEVAGIRFKDKDGVQIMKDYMASGSFARGKDEKAGEASMVFVGNIDQSVDNLLKTSTLFEPFPAEMGQDTAFLDRMHCYLPGWEVPKFKPKHFTNDYGFISDYLSEFVRELRKEQMGNVLDTYFTLGNTLNQRDTIAVRRTVDGLLKLMYPDGRFGKDEVEEVLRLALEMRRRVKEQLKKLGGMEFYDVNFSYVDQESMQENYVTVPEQGGSKLIPEGPGAPGQVYSIALGKTGMLGCFRLEARMMPDGTGKFSRTGIGSDRAAKEAAETAFNYLRANVNRISGSINMSERDYIVDYQDLQGLGMTDTLAMPTLIVLCSVALNRPVLNSLVVLGEMSIGGALTAVDNLANVLQVAHDAGARKVLLPMTSAGALSTVPTDLLSTFSVFFYPTPEAAVFKALGVE